MDALVSKLSGDELLSLVLGTTGILTGLLIAVTAIVVTSWRRARQLEAESALKQDMLQRGMSAEDIERVIRASSTPAEKESDEKPSGASDALPDPALNELTDKQLIAKVAADLAEFGMDANQLGESLESFRRADLETKRTVVQAVARMIEKGADEEQIHTAIVKLCDSPAWGAFLRL
jgi:hypothetical protein